MGAAKKQTSTSRRCRTGCWTCKERRVKCNEERPACSTCMRLGLSCYYGIKLLWREDAVSRGIALGRSGRWSKRPRISNDDPQDQYDMKSCNRLSVPSLSPAEAVYRLGHDWMFLNTTYGDFQPPVNEDEISGMNLSSIYSQFSSIAGDFSPSYSNHWDMSLDSGSLFDTPALESDYFGDATMDVLDDTFLSSLDSLDDSIVAPFWPADTEPSLSLMSHTLSPFRIGENEMYLLNYFMSSLSPRCTPWPAENPFNAIIIPICLSAPTKPLFYTVMAAASHQLSLLRDNRFEKDIWIYRAKALRGFQEDISHFNDQNGPPVGWEQIISTLIMLAFFDISQTGSSTWTVHLRCAQSLQDLLPLSSQMSAEQVSIRRFFCTYFIEHEALARTGSNMPNLKQNRATWLHPELGLNMKVIDSFLGCSHELISLISMISDLAEEQDALELNPDHEVFDKSSLKEKLQSLRVRRNNIERSLQNLQQEIPTASANVFDYGESLDDTEELRLIAETRRLSALIYLYYRLDNIRPTDPRIARFTRQILDMIPKISLRSHALLWQLFVVGTMGLGFPDADTGDADRILVLERLRSLQNTRQLRNVRRAREVVEAVWKARDLGGPEAEDGGWDEVVGVRGQGVSLC